MSDFKFTVELGWDLAHGVSRFRHEAMGTVFKAVIAHEDADYAEQGAGEVFDALDRLEGELSRFVPNSDVSRINHLGLGQSVRVGADTFACLELSKRMCEKTGGAFDVTVGSLVNCWLNQDGSSRDACEQELVCARGRVGMSSIELDVASHTVRLLRDSVEIDLGGVGKGYGVDRMVETLRNWEFKSALVHGGGSTVFAMGSAPGTAGWPVTISHPIDRARTVGRLMLRDRAMSGSGLERGSHIIDPHTGCVVEGKVGAWALAPTAAIADAYSTAFMVMTVEEVQRRCERDANVSALLVLGGPKEGVEEMEIVRFGSWEGSDLVEP